MLKLTEPVFGNEEAEAVKRVLESGWVAEGKETELFEKEIADYVGAKHAVAVCNCTVALELCLRALEVKGRVATPAFGHPATVRAILNARCTPAFVDVELSTYNLSINTVKGCFDAYMPVSWGGNPEWSLPYNSSPLIEDAACSLGAANHDDWDEYVGCFSFHPRKLITTGEGGIVTTNNPELAETLRSLKNFGYSNCKFDDVRAAIGREQLKRLPDIISRRVSMARVYDELLKDCSYVVAPESVEGHTYQTYTVYLLRGNRDAVIEKLKKRGIETQRGAYYLPPQTNCEFENAHKLARRLLALPMAYSMTEADQHTVVEALKHELA